MAVLSGVQVVLSLRCRATLVKYVLLEPELHPVTFYLAWSHYWIWVYCRVIVLTSSRSLILHLASWCPHSQQFPPASQTDRRKRQQSKLTKHCSCGTYTSGPPDEKQNKNYGIQNYWAGFTGTKERAIYREKAFLYSWLFTTITSRLAKDNYDNCKRMVVREDWDL